MPLIEDRLRMEAAKALNLKATPEQIQAGMDEFAGRANLTADQFIASHRPRRGRRRRPSATLSRPVCFGAKWCGRNSAAQGQVTEVDIDRAIEGSGRQTALRVLISELILPAPPGSEANALALARRLHREIKTEAALCGGGAELFRLGLTRARWSGGLDAADQPAAPDCALRSWPCAG